MSSFRVSDQLRYITVRILTSRQENTNWTGAGTGFQYYFQKGEKQLPLLITNKHVIDGVAALGLTFHISNDNNQTPLPGSGRQISLRANEIPIFRHPSNDVDLAAIPLNPIIEHCVQKEGWRPYIRCLNDSHLPSAQLIGELGALEEVVMVGYPTGIVDVVNNFPIARRGITSTPYATNYQGKREFLADIPVYGGSSGSPVFLVNEGSYSTATSLVVGTRFALLGVLYAGHTETVTGQIVVEPIPMSLVHVAKVNHMINLGLCIKSALIEEIAGEVPGW